MDFFTRLRADPGQVSEILETRTEPTHSKLPRASVFVFCPNSFSSICSNSFSCVCAMNPSTYDPMRRSGYDESEFNDFLSKVTDVKDAIGGMLDGSVDPKDVKIKGMKSPEEIEKEEREQAERLRLAREKTAETQRKRMEEEKERWWSGAENWVDYKANDNENSSINNDDTDGNQKSPARMLRDRYSMDYSRWDSWEPEDPVTMEERLKKEEEEDKVRNSEFEKANPDFCEGVLKDVANRNKKKKEETENANIRRLKGNNFYKLKDYSTALVQYFDALKIQPYDVKTLCNIAQTHIKLDQLSDANEFLDRVLYLDPKHAKALSRRATLLEGENRPEKALDMVRRALLVDSDNSDLQRQERMLTVQISEKSAEARIANMIQQGADDPLFGPGADMKVNPEDAGAQMSRLLEMAEPELNDKLSFAKLRALDRYRERLQMGSFAVDTDGMFGAPEKASMPPELSKMAQEMGIKDRANSFAGSMQGKNIFSA